MLTVKNDNTIKRKLVHISNLLEKEYESFRNYYSTITDELSVEDIIGNMILRKSLVIV